MYRKNSYIAWLWCNRKLILRTPSYRIFTELFFHDFLFIQHLGRFIIEIPLSVNYSFIVGGKVIYFCRIFVYTYQTPHGVLKMVIAFILLTDIIKNAKEDES